MKICNSYQFNFNLDIQAIAFSRISFSKFFFTFFGRNLNINLNKEFGSSFEMKKFLGQKILSEINYLATLKMFPCKETFREEAQLRK